MNNLEEIYNTHLSPVGKNIGMENKHEERKTLATNRSSSYSVKVPRVPYRWRKLKITYPAIVLAMYPYLAEPDSDGDDDIEEGEEDDYMRWDPIQGIHVKRETPLRTTVQQSINMKTPPITSGEAEKVLAEDLIGVEILLEAAKALFDDGQDDNGAIDDGYIPVEQPNVGREIAYGADYFSPNPPALMFSSCPSLFAMGNSVLEYDYNLHNMCDYPRTSGRGYASLALMGQEGDLDKIDSFLVEVLQDPQTYHKKSSKEHHPGELGIGYDSPELSKAPEAGGTFKIVKKKSHTKNYQSSAESNTLRIFSGVNSMIEQEKLVRVTARPHSYSTPKAKFSNRPLHVPRFSECNPVHRFHNFKRSINYRCTYDKKISQAFYKPKKPCKKENLCDNIDKDKTSIVYEQISRNNSGMRYENPNCGIFGRDPHDHNGHKACKTCQNWELPTIATEETIARSYIPPKSKDLSGLVGDGAIYVGHTGLTHEYGTSMGLNNMGFVYLPLKKKDSKERRDNDCLGPNPITVSIGTYVTQNIQNHMNSSGEYDLKIVSKMESGRGTPPKKQGTLSSVMDGPPISVQEVFSKISRGMNKPSDKQSLALTFQESPVLVQDIERDLIYKKGEAAGRQHIMEVTKKLINDTVKQRTLDTGSTNPKIVSASSIAIERSLQRAVLRFSPDNLKEHQHVSKRIGSTPRQYSPYTRITQGGGQHWESHIESLDLKSEESRKNGEASDRSRREHLVYSKAPRETRRRRRDSKEVKSSSRKHHRHRSASKEAELKDRTHHRRRHWKINSPNRSHKSPHRRRGDYESDKSRIRAKEHSPDRGRRRYRDREYNHDYQMPEFSSRSPFSYKCSNHTPSPSPVHLVKVAHQQEGLENTSSIFKEGYDNRKSSKDNKSRYKSKDYSPHRRHHSPHTYNSGWNPTARHRSSAFHKKATHQQEAVPDKARQNFQNRWNHSVKKTQQDFAQSHQGSRGNGKNHFRSNTNYQYRGYNNINRGSYHGRSGYNGGRALTWMNSQVKASSATNMGNMQVSGEIVPEPRS